VYGPCFSSIVGGHPLRSPTRHRLGELLPRQLADGTQAPPKAPFGFPTPSLTRRRLCGISRPFGLLSPTSGQVTNALLTRSPLSTIADTPFDLHGLGTPPAFILSQDQTLRIIVFTFRCLIQVFFSRWNFSWASSSYHSSVVKVLPLLPPSRQKARCLLLLCWHRSALRRLSRERNPSCSLVIGLPSGETSSVLGVVYYTRFAQSVKGFPGEFLRVFFFHRRSIFIGLAPSGVWVRFQATGCIIRRVASMSRDSVNCLTIGF
jgi:hypothetical protein